MVSIRHKERIAVWAESDFLNVSFTWKGEVGSGQQRKHRAQRLICLE